VPIMYDEARNFCANDKEIPPIFSLLPGNSGNALESGLVTRLHVWLVRGDHSWRVTLFTPTSV